MREINEQWVEAIDGKRHMVKAVKGVEGEKLCTACIFKPRIYPDYSKIRHDTVQTPFRCAYGVLCPIEEGYIKDLGPVNEEGCLAEERTGLFPRVAYVEKDTWVAEFHNSSIDFSCYGKTKQQAIDVWNRRAM